MTRLDFEDAVGYADFRTFVARAQTLDSDGAVRLQADGTVLAAYVGVLPGRGLMGDGGVVGLRTMRLALAHTIDTTVALSSLADRLARGVAAPPASGHASVDVPTATVQTPWAAMTPPRGGWEPVGTVPEEVLWQVARDGITQIVTEAGPSAGSHAVADLRQRMWGRLTDTVPPVAAGAAFAAYALGFLEPGGDCAVAAHGRWTRLSTPRGHVLVR